MDTQIHPNDIVELELYRVHESLDTMSKIFKSYDDDPNPEISTDVFITLMLETDYCLHMIKLISQRVKSS